MIIKNIVFDVGDVLVRFRWRELMQDLNFTEEEIEFLGKNMVQTEYWGQLDEGVHSCDEAPEHFSALYPQYTDQIHRFWDNLVDIVKQFPYSDSLIRSLKNQGYGVYLLSNYPEQAAEMHWSKFTFMDVLDGCIISALEKLIKPDHRIFQILHSRFGLELSECIFIDDRDVNVKAANEVGMHGIQFTGYKDLQAKLKEIGIEIPNEA